MASKPSPTPSAISTTGDPFHDAFKAFSKFGDSKSDGKTISLSQSDKWMKQAKIFEGKKITTTDTGISFKKLKSLKVSFEDYKKFINELAGSKKMDPEELKSKMISCGQPGHHGIGIVKDGAAVERLTDTSKYTGAHKQRFDESGKGKGIHGREDIQENTGYVAAYKNKDTYDKRH